MTPGGPPDDPAISDDARLFRRLSPEWVVPDNGGGLKVSSQAFQDQPDGSGGLAMSVFVERLLIDAGLSIQDIVVDHPGYGVGVFKASDIRAQGLGVVLAPNAADGPRGQAHAHVICHKSGSVRKAIARACAREIDPQSPSIV